MKLDILPQFPQERTVGIGCIGCGFIMADCHLPAYRQVGFNPVAITSQHPEHARKVASLHDIPRVHDTVDLLLQDENVEVLDIAVPPDVQVEVVRQIVRHDSRVRGILVQKPLASNYAQAREVVDLCRQAGIMLAVNQNMRYDQSIRGCKCLLDRGLLGEPVLATIDMRAIPHWMPWQQRQGWLTLRIMSIHHLDTFRYLFGDPERVFASVRCDPRTARRFDHEDGICLYILEYGNGLRAAAWDDVWAGPSREGAEADHYVRWRVEGTEGMAKGSIGWPQYPKLVPSTLDYTTTVQPNGWHRPRWKEVWFPDAFAGPMAQLLCALEEANEPQISGDDNLITMALVEACYLSAQQHRAVYLKEIIEGS